MYHRANLVMEGKFILTYVIVQDILRKLNSPSLISSECSILKRLQLNLLSVLDIIDNQMSTEKRFIHLLDLTDKYSVSEASKELIIRVDYIPAMKTWFQSLRVLLDETSHAFDEIIINNSSMIDHGVSVLVDKLEDIVVHRPPDPIPDIRNILIPTSSSFVLPRPKDQNSIIELLLGSSEDDDDVHVIPIMGDVGIGKTTLAKLVYNDQMVDSHFDKKIWLSLSDFPSKNHKARMVDVLRTKFRDSLLAQKILLVLDGVSNEMCCSWDVIGGVSFFGTRVAKGSRILITTRSRLVSSKLGTVPPYELQPLSNNDCWSLFQHFVPDSELLQPSEEVMKSFEGFPSIVATVGYLYNTYLSKRLEAAFQYLSMKSFWDVEIEQSPPTLLRKYHGLSSVHLKQCFVYCSLFPKVYAFSRHQLILLWMAEGFLQPIGGESGTNMEDLGLSYFNELLQISFLQPLKYDDFRSPYHDEKTVFFMPEYVYEFAEFISSYYGGGEYHRLHVSVTRPSLVKDISEHARHSSLFCSTSDLKTREASFSKSKGLRSLLCGRRLDSSFVLNYFTCLRVLDLSYAGFSELPDSIFNMIHLKYLDLSHNKIEHLPETIGLLKNLETFRIGSSTRVKTFPRDMGKLLNLRHLEIGCGYIASTVPPGIQNLTNLQTLLPFTIGERQDKSGRIEVLRELKNLRGSLVLLQLENLLHDKEEITKCGGYCLADKENIHKLKFHWDEFQDAKTAEDMLESLQPHTNLRHLEVNGYRGSKFPDWVGSPSFSYLESIHLWDCSYCEFLPPLGQLPYLNYLEICQMDSLQCIDDQFCSSSRRSITTSRFSSLKTLQLGSLRHLQTWSGLKEGDMPLLERLCIEDCNTLMSLPSLKFLHSLQKLSIRFCKKIKALPDEWPPTSLNSMSVYRSPSLLKACTTRNAWWKIIKKTMSDSNLELEEEDWDDSDEEEEECHLKEQWEAYSKLENSAPCI